ncbi:MAG: ComEC/Rec2 family competence protein [Microbacterium sp.]
MKRDLRLLPLACAAWAAALVCVFVPGSAGAMAAAMAMGCGVCIVLALALRSAGGGFVVVVLAACAAVSLSVFLATPGRDAAADWDGRVVEATAEITSSASVGEDGRLWFEAQLIELGPPGAMAVAAAPVRIGVDRADGYDMGAGIRVTGQAAATDAGERSVIVVFASTSEIERPASGVFAVAAGVKSDFVERALRLPEPGAGLLPGLAVGDTRAVTAQLDEEMRTSGLSHLTAVSGANCAIVVGAVFWLVALCGGGRWMRVAIALTALAAFVVLVTPEPSVIRAAVMAAVAMLSVLLGRPSAGAGMLALCAAGILIADPWLASTPGFALSVLASGALILLAPPLARGMGRWMPKPVALAVAVPLAAQLGCGPIIALFAEQQSLVGVAANMIAAPAAPLATVIGLLACLASPVPMIADLLSASAWLPAAWIATTATTSARVPFAQLSLVPGIGSALLVAVVSAAVVFVLIEPCGVSLTFRSLRWARGAAAGVLVVVLSQAAAQLLLAGPLATATNPDGWAIAACDVGQGDALVVRSEGEVAVIDTGPEPGPLDACLRALGVDRVDLLVLTHFDLDHVGGVEAVQGRVRQVMHGPVVHTQEERMLAQLGAGGAEVVAASAGMSGTLGGASWKVLWPQRDSAAFPSGNDASVVMLIEGGGVPKSLFLGDLSAEAQRMLARTARVGDGFAVVKVAHHGSADQDPALYEALRPVVAVISVGEGNDYGHPRDDTLALLDAVGAHVLRTDEQGRVLIALAGDGLEIWTDGGG